MSNLRCHRCHLIVVNPKELLKHAKNVHAVTQCAFPCPDCQLSGYDSKKSLTRHLKKSCWGPKWAINWIKNRTQPVNCPRKVKVKSDESTKTNVIITKVIKAHKVRKSSSSNSDQLLISPELQPPGKKYSNSDKKCLQINKSSRTRLRVSASSSQSEKLHKFPSYLEEDLNKDLNFQNVLSNGQLPGETIVVPGHHVLVSSTSSEQSLTDTTKFRSRLRSRPSIDQSSPSPDLKYSRESDKTVKKVSTNKKNFIDQSKSFHNIKSPRKKVKPVIPSPAFSDLSTCQSNSIAKLTSFHETIDPADKSDTCHIPASEESIKSGDNDLSCPIKFLDLSESLTTTADECDSARSRLRVRFPSSHSNQSDPLSTHFTVMSAEKENSRKLSDLSSTSPLQLESGDAKKGPFSPNSSLSLPAFSSFRRSSRSSTAGKLSPLMDKVAFLTRKPLRRGRNSSITMNTLLTPRARLLELKNSLIPAMQIPPRPCVRKNSKKFAKVNKALPQLETTLNIPNKNIPNESISKVAIVTSPELNGSVIQLELSPSDLQQKREVEPSHEIIVSEVLQKTTEAEITTKISHMPINTSLDSTVDSSNNLVIAASNADDPSVKSTQFDLNSTKTGSIVKSVLPEKKSKPYVEQENVAFSIKKSIKISLKDLDKLNKTEDLCLIGSQDSNEETALSGPISSLTLINSCAESTPSKKHSHNVEISPSKVAVFQRTLIPETAKKTSPDLNSTHSVDLQLSICKDFPGSKLALPTTLAEFPLCNVINDCQVEQEVDDEAMSQASSPFELSFFYEIQEAKARAEADAAEVYEVLNGTGTSSPLESSMEEKKEEAKIAERRKLELLLIGCLNSETAATKKNLEVDKNKPIDPVTIDGCRKHSASNTTEETINQSPKCKRKAPNKACLLEKVSSIAKEEVENAVVTSVKIPTADSPSIDKTSAQTSKVALIDWDSFITLPPKKMRKLSLQPHPTPASIKKTTPIPSITASANEIACPSPLIIKKQGLTSINRSVTAFNVRRKHVRILDSDDEDNHESRTPLALSVAQKSAPPSEVKVSLPRRTSYSDSEEGQDGVKSFAKKKRRVVKEVNLLVANSRFEDDVTLPVLNSELESSSFANLDVSQIDVKRSPPPSKDLFGLQQVKHFSTPSLAPSASSNPSMSCCSDGPGSTSVSTVTTAPCTVFSPIPFENDDSSSLLSSSSDLSLAVSRTQPIVTSSTRKRGRPPKLSTEIRKPTDSSRILVLHRKRRGRKIKSVILTAWRCPGCPKSAPAFPSSASLLAHLPVCYKRSGCGLGANGHSPNRGSRVFWPMPLSLPGTGFGCATCGLLLASESRLDKHRRDAHENFKI